MKDMVPKGTGNSRFLRSSIAADITHEELVALLRSGKFPVDFAGLNSAGIQVQGSAYNKGNVLPDVVCAALELPTSAEPKDAFLHISPEYALKVGDVIGSERSLPSSFLPADGRGISKSTYPDLYTIIGTQHGITRAITRRKDIPDTSNYNKDHTSSGRLICNSSGLYALIFSLISTTNEREMIAVGVLNHSKNEIIYQNSTVTSIQYCASVSVAFDDDYLYVVQYFKSSTSKYMQIQVFNSSGLVKTSSSLSCSSLPVTAVFDGALHIAYGSHIYKLNFNTMTLSQVLLNAPSDASYGIGKIGNYYFLGKYRGTSLSSLSEYTIPGSSSNRDYQVKQVDGCLLIYTGVSDGYKLYKTTNGTNFTLVDNNRRVTGVGHFCISQDGIHIYRNSTEEWFKTTPVTSSSVAAIANLAYKNLRPLYPSTNILPHISIIESDDGYLVPYLQSDDSQGIGVQLVPKDFLFNLPTYYCEDSYLKIKVKKTGV